MSGSQFGRCLAAKIRATAALSRAFLAHASPSRVGRRAPGRARQFVVAPADLIVGALDALTRIEMQSLLETAWRREGFTALLVTHDVAEAIALADRIVLLEDGAVALDLEGAGEVLPGR